MKAINIIGIVLAIAIVPLSIYYIELTSSARWASWDVLFDGYSSYSGPSASEVTFEGGSICLLFGLFFVYQCISNMIKIKTMTTKVMSIISLSLVGLAFLINLIFVLAPGEFTFDEGGQMWMIIGVIMLAFSIVFLVQSVQFANKGEAKQNPEVIDDIV